MTHRLLNQIKVFEKELQDLTKEYLAVLVNKSIPLDERYDLLLHAPAHLRVVDNYAFEFKCIHVEWSANGYERHSTVHMSDVISNLEWSLDHGTEPRLLIEWSIVDGKPSYDNHDWAALIPLMKEELLAANCITCENDW